MSLNPRISDWRGQRIWVIGASAGIGAATVRALLARGARVAASARSEDALAAVVSGQADGLAVPADVTDPDTLTAARERIRATWGGVDLTLLVAGTHRPVRAWELTRESARGLIETNLMGAINVLVAMMPDLLSGGGGIGIVSSVAGYRGLPTSLLYGATKAALINLAETLFLDLRPKGVAVYLINPGFVATPLTATNEFKMPALISADAAAEAIVHGLERGEFEIHFPKRFTRVLKILRLLPYGLYFKLVHKATGL